MTSQYQRPCEDITDANTQNSSQQGTTEEPPKSEQAKQRKPRNSGQSVDQAAQESKKATYTLSDLRGLAFRLDGATYTVRTCEAGVFNAYVARFVDVSDVDVAVWPVEDRRNVINVIAEFAATNALPFPFTSKTDQAAPEQGRGDEIVEEV